MNTDITLRIALDLIVFVAAILGWWFVALPIAVVGAWVFPRYAELVVAGFLYGVLYELNPGGMGHGMGIFGYVCVGASGIILAVVAYLKAVVKNHT